MQTGFIDSFTRHLVSGWAADADRPDARLEVAIMVNGSEQGRVVANRPRDGLRQRGDYGDGAHGFEYAFDPPLSLLRSYDVVVRCVEGPVILPHGRFRIERERRHGLGMRPLLVSATGRSGTTLMMRRLGNDHGVVIAESYPYEMKLLTYYAHALEVLTSSGHRDKAPPLDAMVADPYTLGLNPFHHPLMESVFPKRQMLYEFFGRRTAERLYPAFRDIVYDFYADMCTHQRKPAANYFAEKCDIFTPARNFARLAFDGVKEILLVRDPRDVHCSRKSFWADTPEASIRNLRSVQAVTLQILAEHADELLAVRYEDLIERPDDTLRRISEFLGLGHPITVQAESEGKVFAGHGTSRDPGASIGRWKQEMSSDERAVFGKEFRAFLDVFNYEPGAA
jgi:hypothetical protein